MTEHYKFKPEDAAYVDALVESGRFASLDEAMAEALRLLRDQERDPSIDEERLLRLWREGIESGEPVDGDEVFAEAYAALDALERQREA